MNNFGPSEAVNYTPPTESPAADEQLSRLNATQYSEWQKTGELEHEEGFVAEDLSHEPGGLDRLTEAEYALWQRTGSLPEPEKAAKPDDAKLHDEAVKTIGHRIEKELTASLEGSMAYKGGDKVVFHDHAAAEHLRDLVADMPAKQAANIYTHFVENPDLARVIDGQDKEGVARVLKMIKAAVKPAPRRKTDMQAAVDDNDFTSFRELENAREFETRRRGW